MTGNILIGNFLLPFRQRQLTISKTKDGFVAVFEDGHKQFIIPGSHSLILQGEWWYRGRYTWKAVGNETRIKLEVYNVAQGKRWTASLMILPEKKNIVNHSKHLYSL
jgi:hypothetical protein